MKVDYNLKHWRLLFCQEANIPFQNQFWKTSVLKLEARRKPQAIFCYLSVAEISSSIFRQWVMSRGIFLNLFKNTSCFFQSPISSFYCWMNNSWMLLVCHKMPLITWFRISSPTFISDCLLDQSSLWNLFPNSIRAPPHDLVIPKPWGLGLNIRTGGATKTFKSLPGTLVITWTLVHHFLFSYISVFCLSWFLCPLCGPSPSTSVFSKHH